MNHICRLPVDVTVYLSGYLSIRDTISLSRTCRYNRKVLASSISSRYDAVEWKMIRYKKDNILRIGKKPDHGWKINGKLFYRGIGGKIMSDAIREWPSMYVKRELVDIEIGYI